MSTPPPSRGRLGVVCAGSEKKFSSLNNQLNDRTWPEFVLLDEKSLCLTVTTNIFSKLWWYMNIFCEAFRVTPANYGLHLTLNTEKRNSLNNIFKYKNIGVLEM